MNLPVKKGRLGGNDDPVGPEGVALHIEGDVCISAGLVEGEQAPAWNHVSSADTKVNSL